MSSAGSARGGVLPGDQAISLPLLPRWVAGVLVALALAAPLLVTSLAPIIDLPNHLARIHVLADGGADPALAAMFVPSWSFIPNLAMDVLLVPLAHVLPVYEAGRLFVALAIVLPVLGCVALHRAWWGAGHPWPWVSALTAYNAFLLFGLLNYVVGVGLALLGAAWAIGRTRVGPLAWLVAALWGLGCMLSHLIGFGLLLLVAGVGVLVRDRREPRRLLAQVPLLGAMAVAPVALYLLFGPGSDSYVGGNQLGAALREAMGQDLLADAATRLIWLASPFASPYGWLTVPSAALVAAIAGLALVRRELRVAPAAALSGGLLLGLFFLAPIGIGENGMVYQRLALPLALVAIAGMQPSLPRRLGMAAFAAVALLFAARGALAGWVWHDQEHLLRDVRAAIAPVEPGARVLAVRDGTHPWHVDPDERGAQRILRNTIAYTHLPALVLIERNAFFPLVFAARKKQPLAVAPGYAGLYQSDGHLPLTRDLAAAATLPALEGSCFHNPAEPVECQARDWPERYDYVLRLNAGPQPINEPGRLQRIAGGGFAELYRVRR